jgi:hypothetical protein
MNVVNCWQAPAFDEELHEHLLRQAVSRAWQSPCMAAKLRLILILSEPACFDTQKGLRTSDHTGAAS